MRTIREVVLMGSLTSDAVSGGMLCNHCKARSRRVSLGSKSISVCSELGGIAKLSELHRNPRTRPEPLSGGKPELNCAEQRQQSKVALELGYNIYMFCTWLSRRWAKVGSIFVDISSHNLSRPNITYVLH